MKTGTGSGAADTVSPARNVRRVAIALLVLACGPLALPVSAQTEPGEEAVARMAQMGIAPPASAPDRRDGEGAGPFRRMVIRGATLIDGTGAPPYGPVDVVISGERILEVRAVGSPGVPIDPAGRPSAGDFEIDAEGKYLLPGFIDSHAHIGNLLQGLTGPVPEPEYIFKLWLAHGITTVRELGAGMGLGFTIAHKRRAERHEIAAPRLFVHAAFPTSIVDPGAARDWVRAVRKKGADGIKFFGAPPEVIRAAIDEARKLGMKTAFHHAQLAVARIDVLDSARMGLDSMEHWYGLPEALFTDRTIQAYPADYNYYDEQHRFGEAGTLWQQAAPRGSDRWREVIAELVGLDFTLSPTLTIYEANRDVMRERNADWHERYTLPGLRRFFEPNRRAHGSYHFDWTTADEVAWRQNFRIWMDFLVDYKNAGGRVTVGSDSGFIYKLFGFGYVRELELLQEAGFHPLEVLRAATLSGAELLGAAQDLGSIEPGKIADLILIDENPLANFKLLYGTGHRRLDDATGEMRRVGGVDRVIAGGVVYDARALLADVAAMVSAAKAKEAAQGGRE